MFDEDRYRSNTLAHTNMPIDLVFVRHGESEGNLAQDHARAGDMSCWDEGMSDRHTSRYRLTDRGRAQASQAGRWLQKHFPEGFDQYFCSEYVRAMETAACLELPGVLWTLNLYLRERDAGMYAGKAKTPAESQNKEMIAEKKRRQRDEFYYAAPGGESIASTCFRVDMFLRFLSQNCAGLRVIAVVHRNVMMALRVVIERIPQLRFEEVLLKDHDSYMDNCHILHYSRRDPVSREIHTHLNWVRSLLPWRNVDKGWMQIMRPRFTNADLAKMVESVPQIVNNTEEEMEQLRRDEQLQIARSVTPSQRPVAPLPASVSSVSIPIYINAQTSSRGFGAFVSPCMSPSVSPCLSPSGSPTLTPTPSIVQPASLPIGTRV
eukprot:m51a1_g2133 putative phosphoglycerate mutase family protein (377) ;mRNA; r:1709261-1711117